MKALYFFGAFFATVGALGAFLMAAFSGEWYMAGFVVLLCIAAFPKIKEWVQKLLA